MKNSSIPTWISALFFSVLLLSFPFSNLQALERVRWKLKIGFAGVEQPAKRLIEQIKSISEGKIKLRLYKVNTLSLEWNYIPLSVSSWTRIHESRLLRQ